MLTLLLFLVMLVCIAFLWNEGLWGNAITLVNVVLAALIATNYFEPLAATIEPIDLEKIIPLKNGLFPSGTYFWDFLCIWGIFFVVFSILRLVTDKLTKTKVRFKGAVEHAGRIILAVAVGYVMMSFASMTLHMAPLNEHPFGGSFHQAERVTPYTIEIDGAEFETDVKIRHQFLGLGPDYHWHEFVQALSRAGDETHVSGSLSRWTLLGWEKRTFDPKDRFFFKYGARRRKFEEYRDSLRDHNWLVIIDEQASDSPE